MSPTHTHSSTKFPSNAVELAILPKRPSLPLPPPSRPRLRHASSTLRSRSESPTRPLTEALFNRESLTALWPESESPERMTPAQRQKKAEQIWREFW